ncbi:hypothetical protein [Methylobacterium sp. A54F]
MRLALAGALLAATLTAPALAAPRTLPRLPKRMAPAEAMLSAGPIPPGGTLIVSGAAAGSHLRTLELDDLAPARIRLTIPF